MSICEYVISADYNRISTSRILYTHWFLMNEELLKKCFLYY